MYTQLLKSKEVIIRKPHRCWGCGDKFEKGSKLKYCFSICDGDPSSTYWCKICDEFFNKSLDDFEEGVGFMEFKGEEVYKKFKEEYEKDKNTKANRNM